MIVDGRILAGRCPTGLRCPAMPGRNVFPGSRCPITTRADPGAVTQIARQPALEASWNKAVIPGGACPWTPSVALRSGSGMGQAITPLDAASIILVGGVGMGGGK